MNHLFDLVGKIALITGGNRGLGKEMALGLADAGADIVIFTRSLASAKLVVDEVEEKGRKAVALVCNMESWQEIDQSVEEVYRQFGRCDVLVNNAGIVQDPLPLREVTEDMFDHIFQVNTKGPMHLASAVASRMADTGGGSIINVISMGGIKAGGYLSVYCSSKAALRHLTRSMAEEWAPFGIRVNCIAPGPFLTDMLRELDTATPGYIESVAGCTLLDRIATPEEIVGPTLFLATDASSYVTGQTLAVCGGAT